MHAYAEDMVAPELLSAMVQRLRERVRGLEVVYLFGSEVVGHAGPCSDIDLAILARPLVAQDRWELQEELTAFASRDVDLIDLQQASPVMRVQVVSKARVLWEREPAVRAEFEARALGELARLNFRRAAILEDIQSRGSVYG